MNFIEDICWASFVLFFSIFFAVAWIAHRFDEMSENSKRLSKSIEKIAMLLESQNERHFPPFEGDFIDSLEFYRKTRKKPREEEAVADDILPLDE